MRLKASTAVAPCERGATAVEYAILAALVAAVIATVVAALGRDVLALFTLVQF
jgi:Flp pilus assembly pilin Flp